MLVSILRSYGLPSSVATDLFRYAFPQNQKMGYFNDVLKHHGVSDVTEVRQKLLKNGYIIKNCKLFIYDAFLNGRGRPKKFGIHAEDVPVLRRVIKELAPELSRYKKDGFKEWELEKLDQAISEMLLSSEMMSYVGRFITKKKTFLVKWFGVSRDSIQSDLMMFAVYALYRAFPRYLSPLHFKNIAKTSIHNTGMNIIKYHTRGSRHEMIKTEDGSNLIRLTTLSGLEEPVYDQDRDYMISLDQITPRLSLRAQELLNILRGSPNQRFSQHLGKPNEYAIEEMDYDLYKQKCCNYMKITEATANKFLFQLREHLGS